MKLVAGNGLEIGNWPVPKQKNSLVTVVECIPVPEDLVFETQNVECIPLSEDLVSETQIMSLVFERRWCNAIGSNMLHLWILYYSCSEIITSQY